MRLSHAACLGLVACVACLEEQRYEAVGATVTLAADATPTFVVDDEDEVYRVDRALALHVSPPSAATLAKLAAEAQGRAPPYPRLPWVRRGDLDLQVDYALENQGSEPAVAVVTLNGVNEFHAYAPGPEDLHQWERRIALAPGARVSGTITELELDEVAVDLATVVNGAPNSNLVVGPESQSSLDPRVAPYLPTVVPGLVGMRVGIETSRAAALSLEVSIRVQDHGDRAAKRGDASWMLPEAAPFTPIVPERE